MPALTAFPAYFAMLLVPFYAGAGRYFSVDYWLARRFMQTPGPR